MPQCCCIQSRLSKQKSRSRAGTSCLVREVLEHNVGDRQRGGLFKAESQVGLSVALVDVDGVVYVIDYHGVVGDILDSATPAASLEVAAECGWSVGPNFDSAAVLSTVS